MTEKIWHALSAEETIKYFGTNLSNGLSRDEVVANKQKFGLNQLPKEKPLSKFTIFLEQFKSPLVYVLVIAGFITLFFQLYTDTIVIFAAVILNSVVGYFQEKKASEALRELKKVVKVEAKVLRDGNEIKTDAKNLVVGDIIFLSAGDKVPADARLITDRGLKINEAPLTGESRLAEKYNKILKEGTPLADRDNMVYMGCMIEQGIGKAIITRVGESSEIGKIAALVKDTKEEKTPLQKKINKFSKRVGIIVVFLSILIFLGGLIRGQEPVYIFVMAVAVAVAAIPEGLPVAFTVILTLGMARILKRKGLVRKLVSAEALGSTSIIVTDKTLTLTEGRMKVAEIITAKNSILADNDNWQKKFKKSAKQEQVLAMTIAVLCSEAFIENQQDPWPIWKIQGDPTDKAFVSAGAEINLEKPELEKKFSKLDEIPFNSKSKLIVNLREVNKKNILHISGAPEKILNLSSYIHVGEKQISLNQKLKADLDNKLNQLTSKGLRVVAVGYKKINKPQSKIKDLEDEVENLTFVGFIGLKDPLRKGVKEAIKICKSAGMRPIIATGDHLLTAKAVAEELGFKLNEKSVIEGKDLDDLTDEEFQKKVKDIQVYARVEPQHKLRIIDAWQKRGEVVAMTGDGINDGPALKKADIGMALGSGTDVAKEISDLVLLTDDFNIIVAAVEEGRAIIDNIRKVITYLHSDTFTETILIGLSIIFVLTCPVTGVQILFFNLIEEGPLCMFLAFEHIEKDLM